VPRNTCGILSTNQSPFLCSDRDTENGKLANEILSRLTLGPLRMKAKKIGYVGSRQETASVRCLKRIYRHNSFRHVNYSDFFVVLVDQMGHLQFISRREIDRVPDLKLRVLFLPTAT
jgi:acyl-ACP thioesterase